MSIFAKRTIAATAAMGLAAGLLFGAASRPQTRSSAPTTHYLFAARTALVSYLHHTNPLAQLTGHRVVRNGVTKGGSINWSGYADESKKAGAYTGLTGSWTLPGVTCTKEDQITSEWIGLDGATDNTVEQDGTISWCWRGKATYYTWYEMYPAGTVTVGSSPRPGDKISTSIVAKPSGSNYSYTMKLTDSSRKGNNVNITKTCPKATCLNESAEWIAERPAFELQAGAQFVPLPDYKKWSLTNGTVTTNGKTGAITSGGSVLEYSMVDDTDTYVLSSPSALIGGKAFSTTWLDSF